MAQYFTSDFERHISKDAIRAAETDVQLDVMRTWFYQNYEDPAEHTPHDSRQSETRHPLNSTQQNPIISACHLNRCDL